MKRFTLILVFLATCIFFLGCSGGGKNVDGGLPDGFDGGDGDIDVVECSQADVYCIVIEPGAQACGIFQDQRSWSEELAILARVRFKAGETLLPEDLTQMQADLIEKIELGPEGLEFTPIGPGLIVRMFNPVPNPPESGYQTYEYTQRFLAGQGELSLSMNTDFWVEGGVPQRRGTRIGPKFSKYMYMSSLLGNDPNDYSKRQVYDSCDYGHYTLYIITAEAESGDQAVFHKRMYSPDMRGGSMPANVEWAQATVGGTTRSADDYFSLVYSADHHNWNEGYTVLLRPSAGDVHGIVLVDAGMTVDPLEMLYLGDDYTEIRRSPLASYEEVRQE